MDIQERVDFCVELLANRFYKSQIKAAFRAKFGDKTPGAKPIAFTSIEVYLVRAREQMRKNLEQSQKEHAEKAVAFYEQIIRSSKTPYHVKVRAQERLDMILGLEEARRWSLTVESKGDKQQSTASKVNAIFGIVPRAELNGHRNGNGAVHPEGSIDPTTDNAAKEAMS